MRFSLVLLFATISLLQGCAPFVGVGANTDTMMSVADRRSAGAMVEDDTIESKAQERIENKYQDRAHASVVSYNRYALVTGTATSESTKMGIERIIGAIPNVRGIANELVVSETASDTATSDSRLTASVKMRFSNSTAFKADHIKVITENGVVYLMGLVTHAEADAASKIASTTAGVQKVVRVFEYID